ncbi:peptide-methionine (S)-S-oxide reductase MsrA [Crocinitomix algicola]|uniref:peptide-methionine (S)-S-oxide reductase MsrA n=1 Tax=Crocinitomix algicola TaxID=1740263 RepID=UPI000872DD5B|nr:peptide-methionine (S)-S-oxide reductase MsrA [Crocinitomix algicola]
MLRNLLIVLLPSLLIISVTSACEGRGASDKENINEQNITLKKDKPKDLKKLNKAYFASGCFWCVEAIFESVIGVEEVYNGYSGGHTKNPTYELSNTGTTGHAEAVEVYYDSTIISFNQLVDVYFGSQNIEQVNGQGPDHGSQYRSIVFYQNMAEKEIIDKKILQLEKEGYTVAAEVIPFDVFWMGEDYHQDYEKLHPNQGYIQTVSIPRLKKFQSKYPDLLKSNKGH